MPDYKKMYQILFNKITDIVNELQVVQQQAEELYIANQDQITELILCQEEQDTGAPNVSQK